MTKINKYHVNNNHEQRVSGFTLADMLIALSLLSLLATIGIPSFTLLLDKNKQESSIEALADLLSIAKQSAINFSKPVILCPSADTYSCSNDWDKPLIVFIDQNNDIDTDRDNEERLITTANFIGEKESLAWRGFGSDQHVRFTPYGTAQNGTFYYCRRTEEKIYRAQLIINNTGRARRVREAQLKDEC